MIRKPTEQEFRESPVVTAIREAGEIAAESRKGVGSAFDLYRMGASAVAHDTARSIAIPDMDNPYAAQLTAVRFAAMLAIFIIVGNLLSDVFNGIWILGFCGITAYLAFRNWKLLLGVDDQKETAPVAPPLRRLRAACDETAPDQPPAHQMAEHEDTIADDLPVLRSSPPILRTFERRATYGRIAPWRHC